MLSVTYKQKKSNFVQHFRTINSSETTVYQELSNIYGVIQIILKKTDNMDTMWMVLSMLYPCCPRPGSAKTEDCRPTRSDLSNLDARYKNLDYVGGGEIFNKLAKKDNSEVHRTKAYTELFQVARGQKRKIISDEIDLLKQTFRE